MNKPSMRETADVLRSRADHAAQAGANDNVRPVAMATDAFLAACPADGTLRGVTTLRPTADGGLASVPVQVLPAVHSEADAAAQAMGIQMHQERRAGQGWFPGSNTKAAGQHLQAVCHGASYDAGWWQHAPTGRDLRAMIRTPADAWERMIAGALVAQKLMLSVSELAEGMEGLRKDRMDDKLPHRKMLEVELADAAIRIFDLGGALGFDLGTAIAEKMAFNAQRPDHKAEARAADGGKAF